MSTSLRRRALALTSILLASSIGLATPAHAAAALVGNVLSTSDLNAVSSSPLALAQALAGTGVSVSNATFSGNRAQAGSVHIADPSLVSFNDGVVLSSGNIADIVGPNKSDGITGDMAGGEDSQLTALIAQSQTVNPMTYDATSLEFDFVPTGSDVYFTYVFGSDEYLEWVNLYNDVFGFWINGVNCATVAGQPITIDTINDQVNSASYRDNSFSAPPANPLNIELDGLSVELICHATVNPGVKNHVKLAIADTSDQILDSVVILKSGTFSTVAPESCNNGVDDNSNSLTDMDDTYCTSTVTPAPTGTTSAPATGSDGHAPAFTGAEGSTIYLDASALGWVPQGVTKYTSWSITPLHASGSCTITSPAFQALASPGVPAVATAVCTDDGEYTARIDGWTGPSASGGSEWDIDVDFFVLNAPPVIEGLYADSGFDAGTPISASAFVTDPGASDVVTCSLSWGDGTSSVGTLMDGLCSAEHTYAAGGDYIVSMQAKDGAGDAAATATLVQVNSVPVPPTVTSQPAALTVMAGQSASFAATATGDPLPDVQWQQLIGSTWTDIAGATSTTYSIAATTLSSTGAQFRAVFSNTAGVATTNAATLTVKNPVTITAFTPATGGVGTAVTITGSGFTAASTVTFNGKAAIAIVKSATQILTSVPSGATTGKIAVTVSGAVATSATNFTVATKAAVPTVTAFTPTSGVVGTTITITGTNLVGAKTIKIGTLALASWTVVSPTSITAVVPTGAVTGKIAVTTDGGTGTSTASFTVTVPKLTTALTYTGSLTAVKNTAYTIQATLTAGAGVSGKAVTLKFNGKTYTATTNAQGVASAAATAPKTAGTYAVTAAFAGDTGYTASSASANVVVK